ncbi:MAG: FadR family transcriptional regulator [Planctomycetes bacterium]|nr:FadR family transcriptional regulator [Planctomycetota bacterium]
MSRLRPPALRRARSPRPANLCHDVIERLKALIGSGAYRPGTQLPSERELSRQLGVSRPSLREALRTLSVIGALETRHGSGSQVAASSVNILKSSFEFLLLLDQPTIVDLYETRELIEVHLVGRAAERRTDSDLVAIRAGLDGMRGIPLDDPRSVASNLRFHAAIAAAAHSLVLERMMSCLHDGIRATMEASAPGVLDAEVCISIHEQIHDAIARQNPADARRAMTLHMGMGLDDARRMDADQVRPTPSSGRRKRSPTGAP